MIATTAAGSRQQSRFLAMMENYDRTVQLVDTAYDSAGRSSEQFGKYSDTLEYKLNQLTNTWEQMRLKFLDSSFLKNIVNLLNDLVSAIGDMDGKQLMSIAVIGMTLGKTIITNLIDSIKSGTTSVQQAWKDLMNKSIPKKGTGDFSGLGKALSLYSGNTKAQFLSNTTQILGSKQENAPNLGIYRETQKTQELQKQLNIYSQLLAKAKESAGTEREISEEDKEQLQAQIRKVDSIRQELGYQKEINQDNIEEINQEMQDNQLGMSKLGETASSGAKNAIAGGLTAGITMAIAGADFETIAATIGGTFVTTFVSSIIPALLESAISAIGVIAEAIGAIYLSFVGAALAAVAIGVWFWNEQQEAEEAAHQAELNRLKDIQKTNEELHKKQIENLKESANTEKKIESLDEALEIYETLSNKSARTQEEEEELTTAINTLNEDFSDIVLAYDENTQKLTMSTEATDNLREELELQRDSAQQEAMLNMVQSVEGTKGAAKTASQLADEYSVAALNDFNPVALDFTEEVVNGLSYFTGHENIFANIYDKLNISEDDLKNEKDFLAALEASGKTVNDFRNVMSDALKSLSGALDEDALKEARIGAENYYSTLKLDGEQISSDLAKSLSYMIQDIEIDNISEDQVSDVTSQGVETNKNFLRNYLQEYQKTGTVSNDGGVEKALQGLKVGDKTADEIIKAKIDEFKQNEETLMDGFDGNLAEWSKLPEDFRQWLDDEGYEEILFDDDIRKDASKSKELLDSYFYELFLAESNSFNLLTQEELDAQSKNLGEINQLFSEASKYTKEQFLASMTHMVENLPEEIRDGILAGQGLKWNGTSVVEDINNAVEDSIIDKYNDTIAAVEAYGVTGASEVSQELNQAILDYISQFNLKGQQATDFAQGLIDVSSNVSEEAINSFYSLDFGNMGSLDLSKAKEEYKKLREEAGISISEIEQEWNELVEFSKETGVIEFKITGIEDLDNIHSQVLDFANTLTEGFDKLSTAISNQAKDGSIAFDDYYDAYKALEELELNPEEYLTSNDDGTYSLASKEVADAVNDQLSNTEAITEEIEAAIDARIAELELQIAILNAEGSQIAALADENLEYDKQLEILQAIGATKAQIAGKSWVGIDISGIAKGASVQSKAARDQAIAAYKTEIDRLKQAKKDKTYLDNIDNVTLSAKNKVYKSLNDSISKGIEEKNKDVSASKDAADAADKLAEAQKKLNEAMYGTELYKGASDALSNYTTKLEELAEAADTAKEKLEALTSEDSPSQLMDEYFDNVHQEAVTLEAENRVIEQSMANMRKILDENYSQYFKENNGKLYWNASLNDAQMNDQFKDYVYKQIEEYNKLSDNIKENNKKIEAREKEYQEMRKKGIDARVALEDKVIQVLEEKYQAEIDATQKKYDALKEADDDYLSALEEAIQKQRELRERDEKYQDLATKEKRLSLLERDTSGANRKDIASQRKELENSRQEMMDSEVDRIIDEMKKLYETQQESREAEIEYMEAMKENAVLVQEANEILANHQTYDELLQWFYENNSALTEKSVAQLEQFNMELEEEFNQAQLYFEVSAEDIKDLTQVTEEEVVMTMKDIGETLTTEADRSFQEVTEKVKEEIESAQEGLQSALDAATAASNAVAGAAYALADAADNRRANDFVSNSQQLSPMQQLVKNNKGKIKNTDEYKYGLNSSQAKEAYNKAKKSQRHDISSEKKFGLNNSQAKEAFNNSLSNRKKIATRNLLQTLNNSSKGQKYAELNNMSVTIDGIQIPFAENKNINKMIIKYLSNRDMYDYSITINDEKIPMWKAINILKAGKKYAKGGLVDYTGPAWVDGKPNKPEAFLTTDDTRRIGEAAKLLSNLPILNSTSSAQDAVSANVGDTSIEIHINVESLASDYDVDKMIERVKQDIVDVSKPVGTPVILRR